MNTWSIRDILVVAMLIFNMGGLVWGLKFMYANIKDQFAKVDRDLTNLFGRMSEQEQAHARIEGVLNGKRK